MTRINVITTSKYCWSTNHYCTHQPWTLGISRGREEGSVVEVRCGYCSSLSITHTGPPKEGQDIRTEILSVCDYLLGFLSLPVLTLDFVVSLPTVACCPLPHPLPYRHRQYQSLTLLNSLRSSPEKSATKEFTYRFLKCSVPL